MRQLLLCRARWQRLIGHCVREWPARFVIARDAWCDVMCVWPRSWGSALISWISESWNPSTHPSPPAHQPTTLTPRLKVASECQSPCPRDGTNKWQRRVVITGNVVIAGSICCLVAGQWKSRSLSVGDGWVQSPQWVATIWTTEGTVFESR
jgi:hypothetical protein